MCLGIPGRIVEVSDTDDMVAIVEVGGVRRPINICFIAEDGCPAQSYVGTWVLIHVGFAMSRLDEAEAARTLELLDQLGDVQAELDAMRAAEPA
jgi:hydrogenase expression/formation protein HypC